MGALQLCLLSSEVKAMEQDQVNHLAHSAMGMAAVPAPFPPPAADPYGPYQHIYHQQQQQHPPHHHHQLQQQQQLQVFWAEQCQEVEQAADFKNHSLPLARIKKIMKADEDVRMIAAEAPVVFSRACEMFILELTHRSWANAEENKRRTLQKNDIAATVTRTDVFDFLLDIVPQEDARDDVAPAPAFVAPTEDPLSYYYVQ